MGYPLERGGLSVINAAEMYQAEALAEGTRLTRLKLMENACESVAAEIRRRWSPRKTLVVCGPGNNGGDGIGIACILRRLRWSVDVALVVPKHNSSPNTVEM